MRILLLIIAISFISCGNDRQVEHYELTNPLTALSEENHIYGYGQRDCFTCHVRSNIHQDNRSGSTLITLARELTATDGIDSCSTCHGNNGL